MTPTDKIDLYKQHKDQYAATDNPILVTVNEAVYLAICGRGAPGGPEFTDRVGALYAAAFTVKMTRKFAGLQDYVIGKLEAQWWRDGSDCNFADVSPEQWNWRLMIRTPPFVRQDDLDKAVETLLKKDKTPCADQVKLESIAEGPCVQMLHVGPYTEEGRSIAVMKAFAEQRGLAFDGCHHEIYLSDPRRIPSEKLRTILRHPVTKKGA